MTPTLRTGLAVVAIVVLALAPFAPITGWTDPPPESLPSTLVLQGTVRDFEYPPLVNARNYNPDFQPQGGCGIDTSIVTDFLSEDGRPVYAGGSEGACRTTHGAEHFNMWFRDTPGWNLAVPYEITATLVEGSNPPLYQYKSNSFFPIDDAGWNGPLFEGKQLATADDGLPLRFLNGSKIIGWSRGVWAVLFGLSLAAFVHIVLRPGSGYSSSTSSARMITVLVVSLLFVLTSVGLWAYFRWRPERWIPERALGEVEFADIERL